MQCEQHLALSAILIGLRRTGAIDRRAVRSIVAALEETAVKARVNSPESADHLLELAGALAEGPGKSCLVEVAA